MAFASKLAAQLREALMGWQHDVKQITAAVTLKFYEITSEVTTPGASNFDITLPPMDEAIGLTYTITSLNAGGGTATVKPGADAPALTTAQVLKGAGDFTQVAVNADRSRWVIIDSKITP